MSYYNYEAAFVRMFSISKWTLECNTVCKILKGFCQFLKEATQMYNTSTHSFALMIYLQMGITTAPCNFFSFLSQLSLVLITALLQTKKQIQQIQWLLCTKQFSISFYCILLYFKVLYISSQWLAFWMQNRWKPKS